VTAHFAALRAALAGRYDALQEVRCEGAALEALARAPDGGTVSVHAFAPLRGSALQPEHILRRLQPALGLRHERVLPLIDAGCTPELVWICTPHLEGAVDLSTWLSREGALPFLEAVRVLSETAAALAGAHAVGVVHLDVCPERVLWHELHVRVAGFGVRAAVDAEGAASGADFDALVQCDLRAFGRIGYQVLTGAPPPPDRPSPARVRAHVPPGLARAIVRCLEDDPRARWTDSRDLARALRLIAAPSPVHVHEQERERARWLRERGTRGG